MAATFPGCPTCNTCDDLLAEIRRRLWSRKSGGDKGPLTRISEQTFGCQTTGKTVMNAAVCAGQRMAGTWAGHNRAITQQQGHGAAGGAIGGTGGTMALPGGGTIAGGVCGAAVGAVVAGVGLGGYAGYDAGQDLGSLICN